MSGWEALGYFALIVIGTLLYRKKREDDGETWGFA